MYIKTILAKGIKYMNVTTIHCTYILLLEEMLHFFEAAVYMHKGYCWMIVITQSNRMLLLLFKKNNTEEIAYFRANDAPHEHPSSALGLSMILKEERISSW